MGYGLASRLASENNTVTVVDLSADLIRNITTELDVRGVVGHGSHPEVLKRAGVENADMIIAVTYSDEVNMIACQVAHSLLMSLQKSRVCERKVILRVNITTYIAAKICLLISSFRRR